jgi:hypothetical protein
MPLDRYRMSRLVELSDLERRVTGTERQRREEDVALLIKAAYDDASDAARAEFVRRAKQIPENAWPWAAVQAAGGQPPAVLVLLRGQAASADLDRGNQIPDRGRPEAAAWAPLYAALDAWDTATIKRWITPQGWAPPAIRIATTMAQPRPASGSIGGRLPGNGGGGVRPGNGGSSPGGSGLPGGGVAPGNGGVAPPTQPDAGGPIEPPPPAAEFSWRHPAVIAAGATMLTTLGVALYSLGQNRGRALPDSNPMAPEATKP